MGDLNGWCFNSQVHAWCLYLVSQLWCDATFTWTALYFTIYYIMFKYNETTCLHWVIPDGMWFKRWAVSDDEYPAFRMMWWIISTPVLMTSLHYVIRYHAMPQLNSLNHLLNHELRRINSSHSEFLTFPIHFNFDSIRGIKSRWWHQRFGVHHPKITFQCSIPQKNTIINQPTRYQRPLERVRACMCVCLRINQFKYE